MKQSNLNIALDSKASSRSKDRYGRLHVNCTRISKADVNGYVGREIVGGEKLDPNKEYRLLRDIDELRIAARSFNNIPLLSQHAITDAEDPRSDLVVGVTGSSAWVDEDGYLVNDLVVWDADEIAAIESGEKRELSCAYHYLLDMKPGEYGGVPYDGIMRAITGNHVALVSQGRAGPDVFVADEKGVSSMEFMKDIKPFLTDDADLKKVEELLKAHTEQVNKAHEEILGKENKILKKEGSDEDKGKKAEGAKDADPKACDEDKEDKKKKEAEDAEPKDAEDEAKKDDEGKKSSAMDTKAILAQARAEFMNVRKAEAAVRPLVGDVVAMDSADEVYKFALESSGMKTEGIHPSAWPAMVEMVKSQKSSASAKLSMDAARGTPIVSDGSFAKMFPNATKVRIM